MKLKWFLYLVIESFWMNRINKKTNNETNEYKTFRLKLIYFKFVK